MSADIRGRCTRPPLVRRVGSTFVTRVAGVGGPAIAAMLVLLASVGSVQGQGTSGVADTLGPVAPAGIQVQGVSTEADTVQGGPVPIVLGVDTIGFLYGPAGLRDPEVRAEDLAERLRALRFERVPPDSVRINADRSPPVVLVSGEPVLVVTPAEIAAQGVAPDSALAIYARIVRNALALPLLRGTPRELAVGVLLMLLSTILFIWIWRTLARIQPRATEFFKARVTARVSAIRFQRFEIVSEAGVARTVESSVWLMRVAISIALIALYLPLIFSFFPSTRRIAAWLWSMIWGPIQGAALGAVAYLPDLFTILVIIFLTWRGLILLRAFFLAVERERIRLNGFYPDWARPTYQLLRVLIIAFSVILIWPQLPNSDSTAFRGVAAFLGLLVTFGSAGAVANAVGGVVMVYMRPFQPGDRVQIADTVGDVEERGMLVTRIRTPKNVVVTIPNSQVLGSHMINYSRVAKDTGIILHTSVTIGYDVPWPRVHEALLAAARKVDGVLETPGPFILQTALGDFTVNYELNAHTKEPERMGMLYSDLHREIQNEFAKAGIEITSPHFYSIRDGNRTTIPAPETHETPVTEEVRGQEPEAS